jgi:catechol 2,3-dioxygenase-like lactoylglutathione lyase family enzyme
VFSWPLFFVFLWRVIRVTETSRRRFLKRVIAGTGVAVGPAVAAQSAGVRGFDHVALPMQNVDAMVAFYRALGFEVEENPQLCVARFGTQMINFHRPALWQRENFTLRAAKATPPCGDLCFVWDGTAASLKAALDRVPVKVEEGPVNRVGGRRINGSSLYVRDPDGNLLEFIIYS